MDVRILHNPRCSKSRATLALLRDRGIEPDIQLYLEQPPSAAVLRSILRKLHLRADDLVRKNETEYARLGLQHPDTSEADLIAAMVRFPNLIERPIVLANGQAAIGRPPERVLEIL
jgi:arsenate reductase